MGMVDDCNKDFDIFQIFISPTRPKQVKMADKIQRKSGGIADGEQGPPWHFEIIFSSTGTVTE